MSEVRKDQPDDMPPEDPGPRYGRGYNSAWAWWWWVLGIIVIGLIIWWIAAAATPGYQRVARRPSGPTAAGGGPVSAMTTIPTILASPGSYMGRAVTIRGTVGQVLGPYGFVLSSGTTARGNAPSQILVVGTLPIIQSITMAQSLEVTGTVIRFSAATTGKELGVAFSNVGFRNWNNQLALQASAIANVQQPATAPGGAGGGARTRY